MCTGLRHWTFIKAERIGTAVTLVFESCSAGMLAMLAEIFCVFHQFLQANAGAVGVSLLSTNHLLPDPVQFIINQIYSKGF
jgi:hypothetical protein